jgi:mannose-6-phosphate isomerase-like protein (cupin superfamily)
MNYSEERPWGRFEVLFEEPGLKLKRITVHSGKRLSLQSHKLRSENWVIVGGSAVVTLEDQDLPLEKNNAVFIPAGARHRIFNPGKDPLVFVEVQTGTYLGEDDIVRYQDDFQRT